MSTPVQTPADLATALLALYDEATRLRRIAGFLRKDFLESNADLNYVVSRLAPAVMHIGKAADRLKR